MVTRDFADPVRTAGLKRRVLLLRHFVDVPKHLTRAREVKSTLRPQLPQRREHVVGAVDVHVHGRKAVGEAFRNETLGREVVTLVKIVFAEDVENTRITLETGRVQRDAVHQMIDAAEPRFRRFEGHTTDQPVHFITQTKEIIREVTTILTGNSSNQRFLGQREILLYRTDKSYRTYSFTKIPACLRSGGVLLKMAVL